MLSVHDPGAALWPSSIHPTFPPTLDVGFSRVGMDDIGLWESKKWQNYSISGCRWTILDSLQADSLSAIRPRSQCHELWSGKRFGLVVCPPV